ncbi:acyltransferase [Legionella sp. D16C41]|uniref:acyltransferase n=1 Tax=Legionella sp. D16C41 TaxID=3402688 RepID=UPI003AF5D73E
MTIFMRGVLAFLFIFMNSCAHYPLGQTKASCNLCTVVCEQRAQACNKTCRNSCPQCVAFSKQSTSESYLYYQHEQYVKGGEIIRELNSYRDPLQCSKPTCNCRQDYRVCVQACIGAISKQLRSVHVCH